MWDIRDHKDSVKEVHNLLREKVPGANRREAELFMMLWDLWGHIPPNLINLATGRPTRDVFNERLEAVYGFRLRMQEDVH